MFDKILYANSVDPDQTDSEGAVGSRSTLFAIPVSILRNNCTKIKNEAKKEWNKVFDILGHLLQLPHQVQGTFRCKNNHNYPKLMCQLSSYFELYYYY